VAPDSARLPSCHRSSTMTTRDSWRPDCPRGCNSAVYGSVGDSRHLRRRRLCRRGRTALPPLVNGGGVTVAGKKTANVAATEPATVTPVAIGHPSPVRRRQYMQPPMALVEPREP